MIRFCRKNLAILLPNRCNAGQFECLNGSCLLANASCEQLVDCINGLTTEECLLNRRGKISCPFKCRNKEVCIESDQVCDNHTDCPFGDDEEMATCWSKRIPSTNYSGNSNYDAHDLNNGKPFASESQANYSVNYPNYGRRIKASRNRYQNYGQSDVNGQKSGSGIVDVFKAVPISGVNSNNLVHSGSGNIFLNPIESGKCCDCYERRLID